MLAEHAGDVLARRREAVVQCRGDQYLHDRLLRPAVRACVEVGALHIAERRRDDDAGGVMRRALFAGQAGEVGELRQRDVHAERARAAAPLADALFELGVGSAAGSIKRV